MNSKLRKDLDEVSEKTNILVRSCRRQFDNIKKICKAVEDVSPRHYIATISRDFGLSKCLAEKYAALVFGAAFRLELSKKKLSFLTFDQVKSVSLMMVNDWGDKDDNEPTLDKDFLASLRELKILLDREKEHRNEDRTDCSINHIVCTLSISPGGGGWVEGALLMAISKSQLTVPWCRNI